MVLWGESGLALQNRPQTINTLRLLEQYWAYGGPRGLAVFGAA